MDIFTNINKILAEHGWFGYKRTEDRTIYKGELLN